MPNAAVPQELRYLVTACERVTIRNNVGLAMRGRSTLGMGWLAAAWLTGCALKPIENPPVASHDDCAAPNPLHMVSSSSPKRDVDPELESLLAQEPADPRLGQLNRRMYQSLHALDAEIRREQRIAACKQPAMNNSTLQAQSTDSGNHAQGSAPNDAAGSAPAAIPTSGALDAPSTTPQPSLAVSGMASGGGGQSSSLHKANVSGNGAGGNGATAPKIVPGSDNDIVARRLRRAAEAETDPVLRAKLWKEYRDYRQGAAVAK